MALCFGSFKDMCNVLITWKVYIIDRFVKVLASMVYLASFIYINQRKKRSQACHEIGLHVASINLASELVKDKRVNGHTQYVIHLSLRGILPGSSFPGINSRSTPSFVITAKRITPPEEPSRAIANASARWINVSICDHGKKMTMLHLQFLTKSIHSSRVMLSLYFESQ